MAARRPKIEVKLNRKKTAYFHHLKSGNGKILQAGEEYESSTLQRSRTIAVAAARKLQDMMDPKLRTILEIEEPQGGKMVADVRKKKTA